MSRRFATLDPNKLGSSLRLDYGNLVVTTTEGNLSMERAAFGNIAKGNGRAYFETYFYSESRGDLSLLLSVGIARIDAPLNQYIGRDATTYGLRAADGGIWNDNTEIVAGSIPGERVCLGVFLDLLASPPTCAWSVDGSEYALVELDAGHFWLPAVSIGSDTAGDVSAFVNFGQRPFENQPRLPL